MQRKTILNEILDNLNDGNNDAVLELFQEFYQIETGRELSAESSQRLADVIVTRTHIQILAYVSELIDIAKKYN